MDGSFTTKIDPESGDLLYEHEKPKAAAPKAKSANLAEDISESDLARLSDMITESLTFDEGTNEDADQVLVDAHEMLGMGPEGTPDIDDFEGADTSDHPLLLTALLRFQAKAVAVMHPSADKAVNIEHIQDVEEIKDPKERAAVEEEQNIRARKVEEFYTEYLFERLPSYREDTDQILKEMGLMGCGLRKIVVDSTRKQTPVMPQYTRRGEITISYNTKNFREGRYTHRIDMATSDLIRRIQSGKYRPIRMHDGQAPEASAVITAQDKVYGMKPASLQDTDTHRIYEVYTHLILEDDPHPLGLARPYIVTIHAQSREVLSVQRNWSKSDPDETAIEHFVAYLYHPGASAISGVGLGHILTNITRALRRAQRRGLEAAYLQNHPSGFKLSNLTIRNGDGKVRNGELVDVDSPVQDIRSAIMMQMFEGPSQGLLALAEKMEANGRELGGIASIDFAQLMKAGVAAGPAMAAFEEATEFQTSVHSRLFNAHLRELHLVHERLKATVGSEPIIYAQGTKAITREDLQAVRILPMMKPGQASKQKAIMEAQAVLDLAKESPDVVNKRKASENYIRALGSPDADSLIIPDPMEEEVKPADPVTEYTMVLAGTPIKAGLMQNHQAHIDAHAAQMKILAQSQMLIPQGDAVMATLSAHIAEHMGMQMVAEVAAMAGVPVEQMGPDMPPEVEAQIAPLLAEAIIELEAQRNPPEEVGAGEDKAQVEMMKQTGAAQRDEMKLRHDREMADLKHAQAIELQREKDEAALILQRQKDDAALVREEEDNTTALLIAKTKDAAARAKASAGASAGAGAQAGNKG